MNQYNSLIALCFVALSLFSCDKDDNGESQDLLKLGRYVCTTNLATPHTMDLSEDFNISLPETFKSTGLTLTTDVNRYYNNNTDNTIVLSFDKSPGMPLPRTLTQPFPYILGEFQYSFFVLPLGATDTVGLYYFNDYTEDPNILNDRKGAFFIKQPNGSYLEILQTEYNVKKQEELSCILSKIQRK